MNLIYDENVINITNIYYRFSDDVFDRIKDVLYFYENKLNMENLTRDEVNKIYEELAKLGCVVMSVRKNGRVLFLVIEGERFDLYLRTEKGAREQMNIISDKIKDLDKRMRKGDNED